VNIRLVSLVMKKIEREREKKKNDDDDDDDPFFLFFEIDEYGESMLIADEYLRIPNRCK